MTNIPKGSEKDLAKRRLFIEENKEKLQEEQRERRQNRGRKSTNKKHLEVQNVRR